jgi:surface antigen
MYPMRTLSKFVVPILLLPFAGCLSAGVGGGSLGSASAGVTALEGGLIGQNDATGAWPSQARSRALEAEFQALQFGLPGQPVVWSADGYSGEVVPTQLYRVGSQDCRGYSHTFKGTAQPTKAIGTACRTQEGFWQPVA